MLPGETASGIAAARQAFERRDFERAERLFHAIPEGADKCEALLYQGLSLQQVRRLSEAIVALQSAAACNPASAPQLALAETWIARGDDNRAGAALEAVLKSDPGNVVALRALASLYLRHELNEKAIASLTSLVELTPGEAQAYADLGAAYAGAVRLQEARAQFERALKLNSNHPGALTGLANLLLKGEQPDKALPLLNQAISVNKNAAEPYYLRGLALNSLLRGRDAIEDFNRALQLGGEEPEILYQLSRVYRGLGKEAESQKALARFSEVRAASQSAEESKREAARLLQEAAPVVERGSLAEATILLQKACNLDPANPQLLFRLAGLQYDTKRFAEAKASVGRALELAPSEWVYHYLLGLIEAGLLHPDAAVRSFETAVRLNPAAPDVHDALGGVAMERRNFAEAVRRFEKAVALSADPAYQRNLEAARQALK